MNVFSFLFNYRVPQRLLLCAAFVGISLSLRGAVMRPDVPSSEYEAFFADSRFQSVGWLTGTNANSNYEFVVGSGVLIAPDWVLTNAHVINSKVVGMFDTMAFSLSNSVYSEPPNYHLSDALFVYPDFVNDEVIGTGIDLGLIHLSTPVADATPATRFYGTDQRGTLMFCAGFGKPGVANNNGVLDTYDGKGRAGSVIARTFASETIIQFLNDYDKSQYWLARMLRIGTPLEWLLSPGDSGGGWFADIDQNGTYELVGISSFYWGTHDFDGFSGAVRVSPFNDWIDTTIANWKSPVLPGDYNHDEIVDAADYVVWRSSNDQIGTGLAADGNNDGAVNQLDYDVWRAHFGESDGGDSFANATVPEPTTWLLVLGAASLLSRRRRF